MEESLTRRNAHRSWRRRGRRAQVAAVATLLGLLLVVTFIANYLTNQLPNQMAVNELNHEVAVEGQLARLAALAHTGSLVAIPGAEFTQPLSLGAAGVPPFASADPSTVGPETFGSSAGVNVSLVGPLTLPSPGIPNTGGYSSKCAPTPPVDPTSFSCTGTSSLIWNFSAPNGTPIQVTGNGGLSVQANISTNHSLIAIGSVGGSIDSAVIFGSFNTVFLNATGGATTEFLMFGNNNTVTLSATGGASFAILVLGNYDSFSTSAGGTSTVTAHFFGGHDHFSDSGVPATVYFTGYNIQYPNASLCPYDNIANTDTVGGTSGGNAYFNNSNYSSAGGGSPWDLHYNNPAPSFCPYVFGETTFVTTYRGSSYAGGLVVGIHNIYTPPAEVAFDTGAVVYAQAAGTPVLIDPPSISIVGSSASIWLPSFTGGVVSESGTGTAVIGLRLVSTQSATWPAGGLSVSNGSSVVVTVKTPYVLGWMTYFESLSAFAGTVTCSGPGTVCTAPYTPGGPVGQIVFTLDVTSVTVEVATFSISVT